MQIGAVSFQPYVYNTNAISAGSLSKVAPIGKDLLTAKTDYSSLTDESLNENPLRKGQTANFMDVLDMQMQMSRMNASRVMKPAEVSADATQAVTALEEPAASAVQNQTQQIQQAGTTEAAAPAPGPQAQQVSATESFQPVDTAEQTQKMQADRNLYQMQRAAEAYQAYMTA